MLRLGPSFARIYPLLVIKGTPLEHIYERGEFEPLILEAAVEQSAYVYSKLTLAGIKVIRVGLQADEELCSEGNIVAGPFHPSFGELVQSFLLYAELTPAAAEAVLPRRGKHSNNLPEQAGIKAARAEKQ